MISRRFGHPRRIAVLEPRWSRLASVVDARRRGASLHEEVWQAASCYALDGESLQTLLDDLDEAFSRASLRAPDAALVRSIALAWSDSFLGLYSRITCVDPLTGLASRQHLQAHVASLYASAPQCRWAIIVIDTYRRPGAVAVGDASQQLAAAVGTTILASAVGGALVRGEVMAALSSSRCGVVAPRDEQLMTLALRLQERAQRSLDPESVSVRVWVEGLPATAQAAASVVDELCR